MSTFPRSHAFQTITIPINTATSSAVTGTSGVLFALLMPAAFTGTAIHYEGSHNGTDFWNMYDAFNVQVTQTVAVDRAYDVPAEVAAYPYWRIVSNAAGAGFEAAARTIIVCCKS
jgi:hypothetical protein